MIELVVSPLGPKELQSYLSGHDVQARVISFDELMHGNYNEFGQISLAYPFKDQLTYIDMLEQIRIKFPTKNITWFAPKLSKKLVGKFSPCEVVPVHHWDDMLIKHLVTGWWALKKHGSKAAYGALYGQSPSMRRVYGDIERLASSKEPVLILGPPGTGKEFVVRELAERGRKKKPLYIVNCASLSKELAASELFGHLKGSFTGAIDNKSGILTQAGDGIVFLDEFGELKLEVQALLLRTLQEHTIRRIGSALEEKIKARIILATNRNINDAIRKDMIRQDLIDRLTFTITIDPLKERPTDIPILANHFLTEFNRENETSLKLPNHIFETLMNYGWPGNVRELRQAIITMATYTREKDGDLDESMLKAHIQRRRSGLATDNQLAVDVSLSWEDFINQALRSYLAALLKQTNGNKKEAIRISGMKRATFYEKLKVLE